MDNVIVQFFLIALITLGASYIQSVTGFGFGIFAMIFLPSLLLYTEANAVSTLLSGLTSVAVVVVMYRKISWKNLVFPAIGCLLSTYFAVSFIKSQKNETMTLLLGIALFVLSLYFFFFSDKIKIKPTWYAGLIAGIASGVLNGMFSIGGPPVVIYYMQSEESSERYLATISAYFVFSGIISVATKLSAGFFTVQAWIAVAVGIAGMLHGAFVGKRTRDRIKPQMIKKAVYGFMAISGIFNVVTSLL